MNDVSETIESVEHDLTLEGLKIISENVKEKRCAGGAFHLWNASLEGTG